MIFLFFFSCSFACFVGKKILICFYQYLRNRGMVKFLVFFRVISHLFAGKIFSYTVSTFVNFSAIFGIIFCGTSIAPLMCRAFVKCPAT